MNKNYDSPVKRNTKEDILNACIDLFSENGISAVSIRDITKKVGINESSLYNHYKNKDEILDKIIEKFAEDFGNAFSVNAPHLESQLIGIDPEIFFQHHLMTLRDRMTPSVVKIWKIIYMEMFRNKRIREFFLNKALKLSSAYYEKVFELMMEKGLIKPIEAKVLADEYNFALMGYQIENMLLKTDNEDITENTKKMFAHIKFMCDSIKK